MFSFWLLAFLKRVELKLSLIRERISGLHLMVTNWLKTENSLITSITNDPITEVLEKKQKTNIRLNLK